MMSLLNISGFGELKPTGRNMPRQYQSSRERERTA
jgi:hypothetical protein